MNQSNIRNFSIIAHIDHGKSTLADRIMEMTNTITERESKAQLLDDMQVEQNHGVTVKSRTVRNRYRDDNGQDYEFNFIDTPGHVDFNYEVAKSLAASDGVILLVDATQGIQAQTVANYRLAVEAGLKIMPVINKVDSPNAQIEMTTQQLLELDASFDAESILQISAKTGQGVHAVLEAIVNSLPAPNGDINKPLKALVFDSEYDSFKGVIASVRIIDGQVKADQELLLMANSAAFTNKEVGIFTPAKAATKQLAAGDVGYIVTGIKDPHLVRIGDTITNQNTPTDEPLPGYEPAQPMVYAGIYPQGDYNEMKDALNKLALNDSSLQLVPEVSDALGPGFRGGFLGIFHLQIIRERLKDEFGIEVLTTAPNVTYRVHLKNQPNVLTVDNPIQFPDFEQIEMVEEPMVKAIITTNDAELSAVMKLADQHKGIFVDMGNQGSLVELTYQMPLSEIAYDFFNKLKSVSHGYASLSTTLDGYKLADVVRVDVQINYARVDALTFVTHRTDAPEQTKQLVHKLKYTIPRRLYPMPAQAVVEGRVIARVDIPPLRKNAAVNGNQYSVSKKQALLRRQSINKRQAVKSDVELPQSVFNSILDLNE
ncbi:translation elongation factor 4 (plasmid) [Nicoliella spurrieriana]|uniref:Elongation factor 4 n=1 Tax=Nicoliella spurrieriana TaxID=2925830 RepID=A0A976X505_9LACO|nr:translation elongation factor 4 [Nicoliella spurrieriana]UQS86116.1 translation elongation factor 4 [Nicoliella spurrieriana]